MYQFHCNPYEVSYSLILVRNFNYHIFKHLIGARRRPNCLQHMYLMSISTYERSCVSDGQHVPDDGGEDGDGQHDGHACRQ